MIRTIIIKFIIFSDSLSVLKAMNHTSLKNPQIQKLLEKCHELLANKETVLCWIPSHIGILGNEMVDQQAKTSLSLEPTSFKIPFSNFKPSINKYILEEWQTSWNNSIGNKLLDIKQTIGEYQSVVRNIRKEKVVLARSKLGCKDQESIQSSTTPDPGYQCESYKLTVRHHKREPRGQPFPSR